MNRNPFVKNIVCLTRQADRHVRREDLRSGLQVGNNLDVNTGFVHLANSSGSKVLEPSRRMHEWGELVMAGIFLRHRWTNEMLLDRDNSLLGIHSLFRLRARELDHLAPLLGLLGNELAEVGRRTWKDSAQLGEPRAHLGIG